jgi:O-antigen ligase
MRIAPELAREPRLVWGIAFWLALIQISIAASHVVLSAVVLGWLYLLGVGGARLVPLPYDVPFGIYAATSLGAAIFSFDPSLSLPATKEVLLLVVPYLLVSTVRSTETLSRLVLILVLVADVGAAVGLWQYRFGELGDIDHRIRGFMSHYMTYSGLLMGAGALALAQFLFGGARSGHRMLHLASFLLIELTLVLTLTRSAWLGSTAAILFLVTLKDRRLLALLPLLALAGSFLVPADVERRLFSIVHPDTSGRDRLYMIAAGVSMVRNHPLLGVGPEMVPAAYPVYVAREAPRRDNPHLHNNLAQIAAERGIACLLAWLWFVALSLAGSARGIWTHRGNGPARSLAAGAFAALLAGIVAGLFEYNFGDSEFLMLFLFVVSIPPILARAPVERALESS